MTLPDVIWLQWHGVNKSELMPNDLEQGPVSLEDVTWCNDQINDTDIRYVIDKRYKKKTPRVSRGKR